MTDGMTEVGGHANRPVGIAGLSLFFLFGATMSALAVVMLLVPGSAIEPLWQLNPRAREGFANMGIWAILLMAVVSAACATAALGLWRCRVWGYWTALLILSINLIGDTANALVTRDWRTLIGLPIGSAMLVYLMAKRRVFLSPTDDA